MKTETISKLDALVGKKFKKDRKEFGITSYKQVNILIVVLTNNGTFNFYEKELDEFIATLDPVVGNFTLVAQSEPKKPTIPAPIVYQKTETHQKLEDSLNAMIDKVMDNKEAIPQAAALCNLTNTMINLEKQQLNLLKAAKSM